MVRNENTFMTVIYWDKDKSVCIFHVTGVTKEILQIEFEERKINNVKDVKTITVEKGNTERTVFLDGDIKNVLAEWGVKLK